MPMYFTGRRDLLRSDVTVRLIEAKGRLTSCDVTVDLSRYSLPANAEVALEAFHNTYLERISLGKVENVTRCSTHPLKKLTPGDRPLFRVKVIDRDPDTLGRLLAAIDSVRSLTDDDGGAAGSLLPLIPKSRDAMGDMFWQVQFVDAPEPTPELWINQEVPGLYEALRVSDPKLTGLIMPEVLRQVLRGLFENEESPTDDESVRAKWLQLTRLWHPDTFEEWDSEDPERSRKDRQEWVDQVVQGFAKNYELFELYKQAMESLDERTDEN